MGMNYKPVSKKLITISVDIETIDYIRQEMNVEVGFISQHLNKALKRAVAKHKRENK